MSVRYRGSAVHVFCACTIVLRDVLHAGFGLSLAAALNVVYCCRNEPAADFLLPPYKNE